MRKSISLAAAGLLAATSSVWAADDLELEEIVVTAQKVSQSIQDVALSISAYSGDDLAEKGISSLAEIQGRIPGVTLQSVGNGINVQIRGIGSTAATVGSDSTAAFNVDGVTRARNFSTAGVMFDVARVEVLRGPQGTLYGRNATVGAINVVTNQPSDKDEAAATIEVGNFSLARFAGMVNVPVSDTFKVRVAGQSTKRDGYLQPSGKNDADDMGARVRTLWTPSEDLSLLATFDYSHKGGQGAGQVVLPAFSAQTAAQGTFFRNTSVNNPTGNEWFNDWDADSINMSEWGVALDLNYNVGFADLYVQPAYRGFDLVNYGPQFGVPLGGYQKQVTTQSSLETRLSSKAGSRITWVAGLFYYDEKYDYSELRQESLAPSGVGPFAVPVGPNGEDRRRTASIGYPDAKSYAAFGQLTYPVLDWFRVTAGGRYTKDKRTNDVYSYNYYHFSSDGIDSYQAPTGTPLHSEVDFSHTDWKAGVEFDLSDDVLLYASASTGYKAGGLNGSVQPSAPATSPRTYEPETLKEYMAGVKNTLLGGRLIINLQGFVWDYESRQQVVQASTSAAGTRAFINYNLGAATISGGELEISWHPTSNDLVALNVARTTGKYKDEAANRIVALTVADVRNQQISFQAPWQAVLDLEHSIALGGGGSLTAGYHGTWRDDRSVETNRLVIQKADFKHDLTLAYKSASDRMSFTLWGRNLSNEAVIASSAIANSSFANDPFFALPQAQLPQIASMEPPRTYGATLAVKF